MPKERKRQPDSITPPLSTKEKKFAVNKWLEYKNIPDQNPTWRTRNQIFSAIYNYVLRLKNYF